MESYEKRIRVSENDLDELKHVNNVRYVQWIQDISKEHWETTAPKEMRAGILWVVKKHTIDYFSSAVLGDEILARTFIANTKGALSIRCVEMFNADTNELLVRSQTEWCLLNALTLRPIRISEAIKKAFLKQ
ncbi:thioesterase [Maribacter sp. TH_r10]|uniref:Acyl-CoA thioesterase n=1 Tax=Maribacter luteus TaxID=2594478 RepID=A0A6I2MT10_9FLAO|nr:MULTISPECIES: acyl-ACP thioesterase domain-containing protein [Maribacter]MDV7138651.1 thioesterase [Maribacter sp. TH_r10]MRX65977.1 acyl-CoA thioesterase [Maribacter luteus]|tara:strand:- start:2020 stop:2415 length:396 start_codon:yes stop_codon:yes gene_type:complete